MSPQPNSRIIAVGGVSLGLVYYAVSLRSRTGGMVIECVFLAFFAWLAFRLWRRDNL
jgi:hypothetical protein